MTSQRLEGDARQEEPSVGDLRWTRYAIENAFDVVNMSLSTTKREFAEGLHEPPT
jgi:hypothetical protein